MKIKELIGKVAGTVRSSMGSRHQENAKIGLKGEVFMYLRDAKTGELIDSWSRHNLIVKDASILLARLVKDSLEPPKGGFVLAVGTGGVGWDLQNPPSPTTDQRALFSELTRKTFSATNFVDSGGLPTSIPTNIVDFSCTFTEAEAVGPLVEMGILGGNISTNMAVRNPVPAGAYNPTVDLTQYETMVNFLTFAVINKPPTSTLEIVWRLSF